MSSCCSHSDKPQSGCNTAHYHTHAHTKSHSDNAVSGCSVSPAAPEGEQGGESCCCPGEDDDGESELLTGNSHSVHNWHISGLDCPSCVKKAENALAKVSGVIKANVSFATMRLQVQFAAGQVNTTGVEATIDELGFHLAPFGEGAPVHEEPGLFRKYRTLIVFTLLMTAGAVINLFSPETGVVFLTLATLWGLVPIGKKALTQARSGTPFGIETLMTVAALGALGLGETLEAGMVLLLFLVGEELEGLAASHARKGVASLMALTPDQAVRITMAGDGSENRETVLASQLYPGDMIEVLPGDRLPADGELITTGVSFDESALTGESVPVERQAGEQVMAGCLSADRVARLKVVSEPGHSAIDRIVRLIEEAEERKAPIERFIDRFSRWYTPLMMVISALVVVTPPLLFGGEWSTWIYRGLATLLIACPCALVISTPAAVTSGLARAARQGILIKGGIALEQLGAVRQVAFDKTGTLTEGRPEVVDMVVYKGDSEHVLTLAAAVENGSRHPLAKAVVRKAEQGGVKVPEAEQVSAQAGKGVTGLVAGRTVTVGSPVHLQQLIAAVDGAEQRIAELEQQGCTVVGVASDGHLQGLLALSDTLRADAVQAVADLKKLGVSSIMLTGDNPRAAAAIAARTGMAFRAGLLPEDKMAVVSELEQQAPVAMVGDGINDAPAMKRAHIGIAMGKGTDVALETADAALTHERITDIAAMVDLSRATMNIVRQNVIFAVGIKAVFLVTSLLGVTGLMLAVMADSGATALVTLNALRLLRRKNSTG